MEAYLKNVLDAILGRRPTFGAEQVFEIFGKINFNNLNTEARKALNTAICNTLRLCGVKNEQKNQYTSIIKTADEKIKEVNIDLQEFKLETDQKTNNLLNCTKRLSNKQDAENTRAGQTITDIEAERSLAQKFLDFVTS